MSLPSQRAAGRGAAWRRAWWVLGLLAVAATLVTARAANADDDAATVTQSAKELDDARARVEQVQRALAATPEVAVLPALRAQAQAVHDRAGAIAADLAPRLAGVEERLTALGPAPARPGAEDGDVAAQRAALQKARGELDAQLRIAKLLAIEGEQTADQAANLRRVRFESELGERTASVLGPAFWQDLNESWPQDRRRLAQVGRELAAAAAATAGWVWLAALAAAAAALAAVPWLNRQLQRVISTRVPHGRVRRSLLAAGTTATPVLATLAAAHALRLAVAAGEATTPAVDALLIAIVGATGFGAYVAALGYALLSPRRPSWRLAPLPDEVAEQRRLDPLLFGLAISVGWMLERLAAITSSGLASAVAVNALFSLALGVLLATSVGRSERLHRQLAAAAAPGTPARRPAWLPWLAALSWLVLVSSTVCLLLGFIALGSFIVRQVAWLIMVLSTFYLLAVLIDDVCTGWLGGAAPAADGAGAAARPPALRQQAAVLLSASCRVVLGVLALVAVLAPFGQGPGELLQRAGGLRDGVTVGEIHVLPGAVLRAIATLAVGLLAVRVTQRWLLERYLPTTSLDSGMRSSAATMLGYVGVVVAVGLALSALGVGIERVAWVASALSVGIGFGLQAVVQNFVSGLILLTERPVKVGDWVALGGIEGDIRRINVRATEVQMGDRSTVIVPNSEFITKVVRNITLANPLGLVQIKLPMPLDTDVEAVRALLLDALRAHPDVTAEPGPSVMLDGIDGASLVFAVTGSVASPRHVGNVKSALLFDILARLKAAGFRLSQQPTLVLREQAAAGIDGALPPVASPAPPG